MKYILSVVALVASVSSAAAQWVTKSAGGAFDDNPLHMALTLAGHYGLALRCKGETAEVVFITPERSDDDSVVKVMNAAGAKLRLRIDKGAIIDLDAIVDNANEKISVVADTDADVFRQIRDAKGTVAVVITVLGKSFHESAFKARGAKAAIGKIMKSCKLDEAG